MKLSQKNFITITIMMSVLLFLFQMSGLVQQADKNYGLNTYSAYAQEEIGQEQSVTMPGWDPEMETTPEDFTQRDFVVYLGDLDQTDVGNTVREWCRYTKRPVWEISSLDSWLYDQNNLPEILLIDSAYFDPVNDVDRLLQYTDNGIHLIFCNLPASSAIIENSELRDLLGIQARIADTINLSGIHLFAGFLLGGEFYYEAATAEEALERQDLELNVPWFYTGGAVETYMVGILSEEQINTLLGDITNLSIINGYLPAIIWHHSLRNASVFVVNGNYIEDTTGLGILSAMTARLGTYDIYPVINAQNVVLNHFPWIAAGTNEVLEEMYNRNSKEMLRDVVWPSMVAIVEQNNVLPTCLMQLQFQYDGSEVPLETDLTTYIKLMREIRAEVGLTLSPDPTLSAQGKISADQSNLEKWLPDYDFYSFAVTKEDDIDWKQIKEEGLLPEVRSIFVEWEKGQDILAYETADVIRQSSISNGFTHTFSDDLRLKSVETALAYSSISVNMEKIAQPLSQDDSWERRYERLAANTSTYWKPFRAFSQTTLVQSDAKIRKFLTLQYTKERIGNIVTVDIQNVTGEVDFLLRTFDETVDHVEGGDFVKVEDGAYLITASQPHIEITLEPLDVPYYYEELS
jgi:hypothetical protein